jgi:DNA-binding protein YbaB
MNIELFCKNFIKKLNLDDSVLQKTNEVLPNITLTLDKHLHLTLKEQEKGVFVSAPLIEAEGNDLERVYQLVLEANLFGQGTGQIGVIGLTKNGKMLVLNLDIDHELDQDKFNEKLEDFLNYIEYWQNKIELTLSEV